MTTRARRSVARFGIRLHRKLTTKDTREHEDSLCSFLLLLGDQIGSVDVIDGPAVEGLCPGEDTGNYGSAVTALPFLNVVAQDGMP